MVVKPAWPPAAKSPSVCPKAIANEGFRVIVGVEFVAKKLVIDPTPKGTIKPCERTQSPAMIALVCSACVFGALLFSLWMIKLVAERHSGGVPHSMVLTVLPAEVEEPVSAEDVANSSNKQTGREFSHAAVSPEVSVVVDSFQSLQMIPVSPHGRVEFDLIPVDLAQVGNGPDSVEPLRQGAPSRSTPNRRAAPASTEAVPAAVAETPKKLAQYKRTPLPPYPKSAKMAGLEGIVTLLIHIDDRGFPKRVSIAKSSGVSALDEVSVQWVMNNWEFFPAVDEHNSPVSSKMMAPLRFELN